MIFLPLYEGLFPLTHKCPSTSCSVKHILSLAAVPLGCNNCMRHVRSVWFLNSKHTHLEIKAHLIECDVYCECGGVMVWPQSRLLVWFISNYKGQVELSLQTQTGSRNCSPGHRHRHCVTHVHSSRDAFCYPGVISWKHFLCNWCDVLQ